MPYRKRYYLTHPWKIVKDIYWNIRNFWHRGRFGYAYVDVWNFCDWYPRVGAEALRYLALHNCGYPGHPPWETPEKWRAHLNEMANKLQRCADFLDSDCETDERNEYKKEYEEIIGRTYKTEKDGKWIRTHFDMTPEEQELCNKYYERQKELQEVDKRYAREVFGFLGENLGRYWD